MIGSRLLALVCCCLAAGATGCTRTSDGSIEPRYSIQAGRYFVPKLKDRTAAAAVPRASPAAAPFPPAPRPPSSAPRSSQSASIPAVRISVAPPFVRPDPSKPLKCRDQTSSGGRVRYVCE